MILRVFANKSTFKPVEFSTGLNVVLADRTKESTKKDSRNGLGKSTLIEIIHFCLGADFSRSKVFRKIPEGWAFSLDLALKNGDVTVTRCIDQPNQVKLSGNISSLPIQPQNKKGENLFSIKDWSKVLGAELFGLPVAESDQSFFPTFRSLIPFFIRRNPDGFLSPFEVFRKQKALATQIYNTFLLGLAWEYALDFQDISNRKKGLNDLKKAIKLGVVKDFYGSIGELEAKKITIKQQVDEEEKEIQSFRVYPQYEKIRQEANEITEEIHVLVNENSLSERFLTLYGKSLSEERPPDSEQIERIYKESGLILPGIALRRLEEVKSFHKTIVENRKSFLKNEIEKLTDSIKRRNETIKEKTDKRADLLEILNSHGALEEFNLIQKRHLALVQEFKKTESLIQNLKSLEKNLSEIKIAQEMWNQKARRDYEERHQIREKAIKLFNSFSEGLYQVPGKLLIDVGKTGFKFDVEIERSLSSGIENMKIFCYDLTISSLWCEKAVSPRFLIHDSNIFDPVDERQRALALEMVAREAQQGNFQYICMLNSDFVPEKEFSPGFDLKKYLKLILTDKEPSGCLFGIRY